jgi:hypothetical protein
MATLLKQAEAGATYPAPPSGLSAKAAALDAAVIWQRIEAYIAQRFTARAVVWTVEGPGEWEPPLAPATIEAVEVWAGEEWSEVFPAPSPLGGYTLASEGPYRVTATVGGGDVPAAVTEAFRRLAEYSSEVGEQGLLKGRAGASSNDAELGSIKQSFQRSPNWIARAMINSGAADLLRPYRRAS